MSTNNFQKAADLAQEIENIRLKISQITSEQSKIENKRDVSNALAMIKTKKNKKRICKSRLRELRYAYFYEYDRWNGELESEINACYNTYNDLRIKINEIIESVKGDYEQIQSLKSLKLLYHHKLMNRKKELVRVCNQ